jgi:lipopolysaccharide biosynthesis protein
VQAAHPDTRNAAPHIDVVPVMQLESSLAKKTITFACSSMVEIRRSAFRGQLVASPVLNPASSTSAHRETI